MKIIFLIMISIPILFSVFSCSNNSQKIVSLNDLINPSEIFILNNKLYITTSSDPDKKAATVYAYSLKDFSFQWKAGGLGKGKGQYNVWPGHTVRVGTLPEKLFICDFFKMGFYDFRGKYLNEVMLEQGSAFYKSIGNKFVGQGSPKESGVGYYTVNLYDSTLKKIKEIYRIENSYNSVLKKNRIYTRDLFYQTYKNRIYIKGRSEDFVIDVYDKNGNELKTIDIPYTRLNITEKHKEAAYNLYRNHPLFGKYFKELKKEIVFPEYLPAIKDFRISEEKLYVLTYRTEDAKSEFYILDLEGNIKKKIMLPIIWKSIQVISYEINNEKLYQIVKDENTHNWNLIITSFKKLFI